MSLKKSLLRLAAGTAAAMLLGSFSVLGAAAEDTAAVTDTTPPVTCITSIPFTKNLTADANTFAPNTSFVFALSSGGAGTYKGQPLLAGPAGGAVFAAPADGSLAFTPALGLGDLSKDGKISFDISKFSAPGIYHYKLAETGGSYDGITYDTAARDLYVYIMNGKTGLCVGAAELWNGEEKTDDFCNVYTTNDLTLTKTVTGNQGDKNKDFTFTVLVTGAEGEKYRLKLADGTLTELVSGTTATVTLKSGQQAVIYGLSANDTYKITETNANQDGYTTTFDGEKVPSVSGKITCDTTVKCVNDRNATIPGGLTEDALPYAGMIALAGGCALFLLRKKRNSEL